MKIATVTLNPAIDQTVRADGFRLNMVNRGQAMQFDAGGKGVNVASFLADYGHATAVTGFLGQENTELFEQLFAHKRIEDHFGFNVDVEWAFQDKILYILQTRKIRTLGEAPQAKAPAPTRTPIKIPTKK